MSNRAEEAARDYILTSASPFPNTETAAVIYGYTRAEKDLGWHLSTEHPPVDEEVIVLLGRYDDFPQIAFGHIVDQSIALDYNGWNIPGVKYWMPMPKLPKED